MTSKLIITVGLLMAGLGGYASDKSRPIVNQSGYNLYEAKRFVCYGAEDGTPFSIIWAKDSTNENAPSQYSGVIENFAADFTDFNPITTEEFVVKVPGHGVSYSFWIADHLIEGLSSRLAYEHFIERAWFGGFPGFARLHHGRRTIPRRGRADAGSTLRSAALRIYPEVRVNTNHENLSE